MRKTKADATKKKPQIGLPSSILDDSDEESCASTTSSSESESEYQGSSASESTPNSEDQSSDDSSTDGGRSAARRKRSSLLEDSSSESDSDVGTKPKRKVVPKKRVKRQESDSDADAAAQDKKRIAKESAAKRKLRQSKLMALSKKMKSRIPKRRRRSKGTDDEEEDAKDAEDGGDDAEDVAVKAAVHAGDVEEDKDVGGADRLIGSSEEEEGAESGSLKDFIVEDEKKKGDKEDGDNDDEELDPQEKALLSLPREFITGSQLNHFQVVVKALLINVLDETFLKSLYDGERRKRYAQEMNTSLFHFDERTILPRLENLKQRSRWTERYKERVECYPKVRLVQIGFHGNTCEACQLQRQCSVSVRLSGQLYDSKSLQEDNFMPNDTQAFSVGSVCARRTEVYHILKHFKYHLFQHCRTVLEEEKSGEEEPVKDTVNRVFDKLQQGGWISEQYEKFQDHLNNADYFQEEKLD